MLGSHWRQYIVDKNPDVNTYAFLHDRWPEARSYPVSLGWFYEIVNGTEGKQAPVNSVYFYDSLDTYKVGEERLACVAEWWKHAEFNATWRFIGPNGELFEFKNHKIPEDSNLSWEYLLPEQQTPGKWTCEVEAPTNPLLTVEFELVP